MYLALDTYRWWGPLGFGARSLWANILAGAVWAGFVSLVAILLWPPTRKAIHRFVDTKLAKLHDKIDKRAAHDRWVAEHIAKLHRQITGEAPAEHPDLGQL